MDIKSQLIKLKDNWLIALIVLVLVILVGSFDFSLSSNTYLRGISEDYDYVLDGKATSSIMTQPSADIGGFSPDISNRIISQSAYLSSETRRGRFQESADELKNIITSTDSLLLNENVVKHDGGWRQYYSGSYSIRVESNKYTSIVAQLKELGDVQEFSESADDITDGYTKLEIELEAERERLSRYEALYNQAGSVEDKLSLTDRIYNQERTIKYYEDRLANMDERVEYTSIQMQLIEKHASYNQIDFISFGALINNIVSGINNLLTMIFFLLPYAALAAIIYYGARWWRRRK